MDDVRATVTLDPQASPPSARARRIDAQRNLVAILDAAIAVLPGQPRASMQEIAQQAGVHRATVHRHFASRDDLVAAVRAAAVNDAVTVTAVVLDGASGRAVDLLEQVTAAILQSADRFRLHRFTTWRDEVTEDRSRDLHAQLLPLFERARAEGDLRTDVETEQLIAAFGGLLTAVLPLIADVTMDIPGAAAFVRQMLVAPAN